MIQLGDPQRARREAATAALKTLGPSALPHLEAAHTHATGETAWRLAALKEALFAQAVSTAVDPTLVAPHASELSLEKALASLFASRGGSLPIARELDTAVIIPASALHNPTPTYWEQLQYLFTKGHCQLTASAQKPQGLVISPRESTLPPRPSAAAGPFFIEVLGVSAVPRDQPTRLRLTLQVAWEPRLTPVMLQLPMTSLIAETAASEVIPPSQRAAVVEASPRGTHGVVTLPVLLTAPPRAIDSIATVRGTLHAWVPAEDVQVRFDLSALPPPEANTAPVSQALGDLRVELESVVVAPETLTVRARADYPTSEALASHRTWITNRTLSLQIDGEPCAPLGDRIVHRDQQGLTREAVFSRPKDGSAGGELGTLSWQLPLAIRDVPVDFLIRDIPLPNSSDAAEPDSL